MKSWLIGKDSDAGRDWGQGEKGTTEDETAGWHHWLNGRESEWTPGVGDGQGGLECCNSWGNKELDTTERLNRRRQWQATPVLLPRKSHGWRSLVGCSPWGRYKSDATERLHFHFPLSHNGEGNGNPLQCSCLENPRDGRAWWAAVYGVAQSWTRMKRLSSSSSRVTELNWTEWRWNYYPLFLYVETEAGPELSSESQTEDLSTRDLSSLVLSGILALCPHSKTKVSRYQ